MMPRSIQCTQCGVVLNLPANAEGRRLKCPKCGHKFQAVSSGDAAAPAAKPGGDEADAGSTLLLSNTFRAQDLPAMPTADGDLRETFELPMMTEAAAAGPAAGAVSDASSLFEQKPAAPRRKTGAEARAQARRCPTCGGVVAVGMSICQTCGLDLDSGKHVSLDDDLSPPPPARPQGIPIPIAVVGGLSLAGSVVLTMAAIVKWSGGVAGAAYFIPVTLFGVFGAVQFLRAKTTKILLAALTLGAAIDLVAYVALPIYSAQVETTVIQSPDAVDNPEVEREMIRPIHERLDQNSITTGITLLFLYAAVSIYLLSPQVNRHFRK